MKLGLKEIFSIYFSKKVYEANGATTSLKTGNGNQGPKFN
jgi:hypothetical protein